MSCIDDPDISIRVQALDLGAGMVNSDNLVTVVERLMKQLQNAPFSVSPVDNDRKHALGVEPAADSDGENPEETLRPSEGTQCEASPLPAEYRISIVGRILDMCSKDSYANILDFEWYVGILVQLVKLLPGRIVVAAHAPEDRASTSDDPRKSVEDDASCAVGWELRNVAVRVSSIRPEAVHAADSLLVAQGSETSAAFAPVGGKGVLRFAAWIVGEYAGDLLDAHTTLTSLIHQRNHSLPPLVISVYLQSVPKVLVSAMCKDGLCWNSERKTMVSLLLARVVYYLEPLVTHPSLEVQERSVELLELMRVASQAVTGHDVENQYGPLLLTKALPALFSGSELNPVAPNAQEKVPQPLNLDLDSPINQQLLQLLEGVDNDSPAEDESADFEWFYHYRPSQKASTVAAFDVLPPVVSGISSYQQSESDTVNPDTLAKTQIERQRRNRDDPFYIGSDDPSSGTSTPFHDILKNTNGADVDVDSIPIMNLDLGDKRSGAEYSDVEATKPKRKHPKRFHIAADENIDLEEPAINRTSQSTGRAINVTGLFTRKRDASKKALLEVDSSGLGGLSLESDQTVSRQLDIEKKEVDDAEIAKALQEVERLRLEMQRASERVRAADGAPPEGTLVKKKKNKKRRKDNVPEDTMTMASPSVLEGGSAVDHSILADVAETGKPKSKKQKPIAMKLDDHDWMSDEHKAAG